MSYRPYQVIVSAAVAQAGAGQQVEVTNDSGVTIAALQPVCIDSSGNAKAVDVSSFDDAVKVAGVAIAAIPDGSEGAIATSGILEDISTSIDFGGYVYVSKTGQLTATAPTEGVAGFVAGDFVIRIGAVVRNADSPSQKDLLIQIQAMGQL